jgi:hypothetical protein
MTKMHEYLTSMDKYKRDFPFYVENLFNDKELEDLKNVIYKNKYELDPTYHGPNEKVEENYDNRFRPKIIRPMSRMLVEFEMPKHLEKVLDDIAKPTYDGDIALCHYNYIEYNKIYSEGKISPILPPHIDADENLVTINYCLDGNFEGWDLYVGTQEDSSKFKRYTLKKGQAIVFSAVNQIHWRPKRRFTDGEFLEIVSMDYCPTTNYRFTGEDNPIDPQKNQAERLKYSASLNNRQDFRNAWGIYDNDGIKDGIQIGEQH